MSLITKANPNVIDKVQASLPSMFPEDHFLSDGKRVDLFLQYMTFFRRNFDVFVEEYLGIKLFNYQKIVIHLMGLSHCFVMVAARALAKSFMIAIWACTMAILYPSSQIIICSGTKGQAKLIITEKIKRELCGMSPVLKREIKSIKEAINEQRVDFHNGSSIIVVAANEFARGHRGTAIIYEEFRLIDKHVIDSIISPFLIPRKPPYMYTSEYENVQQLIEEPREAYISSAYFKSHWMWKHITSTARDMFSGKSSYAIGFDYSVALFHKIKTHSQLLRDKHKFDPMTWAIEYENIMLEETEGSYFTFAELKARQNVLKAMYPRRSSEKKVAYPIKKVEGEVRILSCDIAMMAGKSNDNSVFSCLRLMPDVEQSSDEHIARRIQIPYLEAINGGITEQQAIRINQLFYDFDCDYIVLDVRGNGVGVLDSLGKVLYDRDRDCEYPPLCVFNDEEYANRSSHSSAKPYIYAFKGSVKRNSDIAVNLKTLIVDGKLDFLVDQQSGVEELYDKIPEYASSEVEQQLFFEQPFLDTMLLINECAELRYEKLDNTGAIRLKESSTGRKDRYVSVAMGCFFASEYERDMIERDDDYDLIHAPSCVSYINL